MPHHHSRHLFPALYNSLTREKPSHAFICNSKGAIPVAKMTANKQNENLQNILCSHQWGDLLFGHICNPFVLEKKAESLSFTQFG
jgi:hypothetical protein